MNSTADTQTAARTITVDSDSAGQRLDNFLLRELRGVPKTRIYRIVRKGEVRVNKGRVKPDYRLCAGDLLRIPPIRVAAAPVVPVPSQSLRQQLEAAILFENKALIAIDKPAGLAVHGGSGVSLGLIESLRQLRPDEPNLELVHRLDRDTSGCILVAKRRSVLKELHRMLRESEMEKAYLALVAGRWPARRQRVEERLLKVALPSGERIVRVSVDGKRARTDYRVLERLDGATLIEARPVTGRTHQIRVHCQAVGCAIIGDDKYGSDAVNAQFRERGLKRLFLHARRLGFTFDGESIQLEAPLAPELAAVLRGLGSTAPW